MGGIYPRNKKEDLTYNPNLALIEIIQFIFHVNFGIGKTLPLDMGEDFTPCMILE